jgi:two-component sensor histidine kinase
VKNNLQLISSMLSLQTDYISDPKAIEALELSQQRIKSIALVHEKLYQTESQASIDFKDFLHDLVAQLASTHVPDGRKIDLAVNADGISLRLATASPCGLIVNELVTDSLKHGFPDGREGNIDTGLRIEAKGSLYCQLKIMAWAFPRGWTFASPPAWVCSWSMPWRGS